MRGVRIFVGLWLLTGCASAPSPLPRQDAPNRLATKLFVAYHGETWVQQRPAKGTLRISCGEGWRFNERAPTRVWVYFSKGLGNAPSRFDAPQIGRPLASSISVPLSVVPHRSGTVRLGLRVSSALCRNTLCVPIDQELTLVATVREDSER